MRISAKLRKKYTLTTSEYNELNTLITRLEERLITHDLPILFDCKGFDKQELDATKMSNFLKDYHKDLGWYVQVMKDEYASNDAFKFYNIIIDLPKPK